MKKIISGLIVLMLMFTIAGCGNDPEVLPQEAPSQDQPSEEVVQEELFRIISLSPSQTENLFALGLGEQIIGVSDYCDYPEEALAKEKMGSSWTINLERILEVEPDIVFIYAGGQPEAVEQMKAVGIQVVDFTPNSIDAVFESILETGEITNRVEEARQVVEELEAEKELIVSVVKGLPRVPVFYQVWDEPLQTAGPGSFIHELIQLAGGENIAGDTDTDYPMYSVEALVEKNPEIYFMPPHVANFEEMTEEVAEGYREGVRNRPGYDQIKAIQNNRIELMEPNIASRPGVRIIQGLRMFAEAIHPEVF